MYVNSNVRLVHTLLVTISIVIILYPEAITLRSLPVHVASARVHGIIITSINVQRCNTGNGPTCMGLGLPHLDHTSTIHFVL